MPAAQAAAYVREACPCEAGNEAARTGNAVGRWRLEEESRFFRFPVNATTTSESGIRLFPRPAFPARYPIVRPPGLPTSAKLLRWPEASDPRWCSPLTESKRSNSNHFCYSPQRVLICVDLRVGARRPIRPSPTTCERKHMPCVPDANIDGLLCKPNNQAISAKNYACPHRPGRHQGGLVYVCRVRAP
jgi:hypothetical protein